MPVKGEFANMPLLKVPLNVWMVLLGRKLGESTQTASEFALALLPFF